MTQETVFVGVDVSKADLDVCIAGAGKPWRVKNTPAGWARLIKALPPGAVIGLEPSGGYEKGVIGALIAAEADVRWADPARVRALARAVGAPAKTDRIDAELIARYVAQTGGRAVELNPERARLGQLLAARSAALATAIRLKAQADTLEDEAALALQRMEAIARQEVAGLTRRIFEMIRNQPSLAQPWRLLQTAPGVGPLVAAELLANMPELGCISRKAIAKLAGLAPYVRESGAWKGRAFCSGGRPRPRQALYLAAMAAVRACPAVRNRFQRLVQHGKPKMVALTACMRQMLTALNAMLRDQKPWNPQHA